MAMTRQYPPTLHTNSDLFAMQESVNSLPASRRSAARRELYGPDPGRRRHQQMPAQYAHPLQRHNSYPTDGSSREGAHPVERWPEHMLRRKTPNGILSAAYDGTSVEQNEKPHAMKHILLPMSNSDDRKSFTPYANAGQHAFPMALHGMGGLGANGLQPPSQAMNPAYANANVGAPFAMDHTTFRPQSNMPQIDSMLNQLPMQAAHMHYQHLMAGMQPMLQNPLGPTASGDQLPYGPYWPNGTFIPYRPAAVRDPRFYSNGAAGWQGQAMNGYDHRNNDWNAFGPRAHGDFHPGSPHQRPYLEAPLIPYTNNGHTQQMNFDSPPSFPPNGHAPSFNVHKRYPDASQQLFSQQLNNLSPRPNDERYPGDSSGQSTPRSSHTITGHDPLGEFGPSSGNAQLRDRVFAWAHTTYIDLLKFLQHTRRQHHHQNRAHGKHNDQNRHPIYPKPPRHGSNSQHPDIGNRQRDSQLAHRDVQIHAKLSDRPKTLRRSTGLSVAGAFAAGSMEPTIHHMATSALDSLTRLCDESSWQWVDGMLLVGCLAYALSDYQKALDWYQKILAIDADNVEAMSNLAATLLALNRKQEAEKYWSRSVRQRPSYFEAVEHLIGLLCGEGRTKEAVKIIEHVEMSLRHPRASRPADPPSATDTDSNRSSSVDQSPAISETSDKPAFDYDADRDAGFKVATDLPGSDQPGFGSSGYAIPGRDSGRILALVHAKGNMLYALGDNGGAAKAFDTAVMIAAGRSSQGISGLITRVLDVFGRDALATGQLKSKDPILLPPDIALHTAKGCFPPDGELPGLRYLSSETMAKNAAQSTTSNSLLSLAKIYQDGMAMPSAKAKLDQSKYGVREILALYYLSLSLLPSPSTANNVGILLASVQQSVPARYIARNPQPNEPNIPGIVRGTGVHLALQYYNYGLKLDSRHAHLYTNLGSLLKDIGQLNAAIKMYEHAVNCDAKFDIALANLANAVKDQGRIADAIGYYKRAVQASPDFAEAICGLANALNSVCGWTGRGGIATGGGKRDRWHVNEQGMLLDARTPGAVNTGWIKRVVDLVEKQLSDGETWGIGVIDGATIEDMMSRMAVVAPFERASSGPDSPRASLTTAMKSWTGRKWEGARIVRLVERLIRRIGWQWYRNKYVKKSSHSSSMYRRPRLPNAITVPAAPTVLPFHTFTCPMSAKQVRLISQRNGLRISTSTLKAPWLPQTVYAPPAPPTPFLKVGYVSSDFNNHPLAHLMQSVFGLHDKTKVQAICYATTVSDNSIHRQQIEREAPIFYDTSSWSAERLVNQIVSDGVHILVNLNGYTRGARNEVFAARPAPIHMSFMGFAGTLGAEWCDYLLADETAIPIDTLRPERRNITVGDQLGDDNCGGDQEDWVYGENIVFCRDTFFCCDHRQSAPDAAEPQLNWEDEQERRWKMRKEIFPNLPDDVLIFGNFNQLYKIEPTTFRTWLRILSAVPKSILWLLRFPDLGETNLRATATHWAGAEVASRILFTDVAPKSQHIARARVCDLFLDTPECNAHTTAADVLWSGTPLLTLPRWQYKMCSRMAASILKGALPKTAEGKKAAAELIVPDEDAYEARAIELARATRYVGHRAQGRLAELRRLLYGARWSSALFDTTRWVKDLEEAYAIVWERWVNGEGGDVWLDEERRKEVEALDRRKNRVEDVSATSSEQGEKA